MKKFFKPASLLFYFLMILVFFFAGVYYAGITGAAEGQGLAGGAIVLGYGVISAFIALFISFVIVYYVSLDRVIRMNQVLGIVFLIFTAITAYRIFTAERAQTSTESPSQITPKTATPNSE